MIAVSSSSAPPCEGPRVLGSKTARALLCFWVLLGAVLLVPSPLRDRLRATGDELEAEPQVAEGPALPGLPRQFEHEQDDSPAGLAEPARQAARAAVPIDDPSGAMLPFYRSLARTAARERGHLTRVLHYGDSLIDLDHISGPLREQFQREFGNGGHGFVLPAKPWRWYNHIGIALSEASDWEQLRLAGGTIRDGRLGLGGMALESSSGRHTAQAFMTEAVQASRLEVHFLQRPGGGELAVDLDGRELGRFSTAARQLAAGRRVFAYPGSGPHRLRLIASGRVRVFGFVLEQEGPGITWENLALISAHFSQLATLDGANWREQLALRQPDLVLFQFGANDTISYGGDLGRYGREVLTALRWVREAVPRASCLVIGPLDRLQRDATGKLRSPPVVRLVADKQHEVARAAGCAFWDGQRAMGGPGAMQRWVRQGLALKDLVHLNAKGSRALARELADALHEGYQRSRAAQPAPGAKR